MNAETRNQGTVPAVSHAAVSLVATSPDPDPFHTQVKLQTRFAKGQVELVVGQAAIQMPPEMAFQLAHGLRKAAKKARQYRGP